MFHYLKRAAGLSRRQTAWISLENGFATRKCTVLEKSEHAARLWLDDAHFPEPTFRLKMNQASVGQKCEIEWRDGQEVGVKILPDERILY
jgi:hypothetical protein